MKSRARESGPLRSPVVQRVYRYLAWALLVAAAAVAVLRATALRWWQVPSGEPKLGDPELAASIAPSLRGGDWILLWRLTRPGTGDLVLCPDPDDPSNVVIGRIVAEAHDEVVIHGQEVYVNGEQFDVEYNCTDRTFKVVDPDSLEEEEIYCDMEDVGGVLHKRGYGAEKRQRRKFTKQVESGKVFLLSDNRAHAFDSRHFGTVDRHSCQETIFFRLVSEKGFFDVEGRLQAIR